MHVVANKLENSCHRSMSLCNRSNHNQVVKVACSIVMPQLTLKHLLKWHFIVVHSSVLHGWALISNLKDIASKLNAWHQLMWLKLVLILRYAGAQHKYIFIYTFIVSWVYKSSTTCIVLKTIVNSNLCSVMLFMFWLPKLLFLPQSLPFRVHVLCYATLNIYIPVIVQPLN